MQFVYEFDAVWACASLLHVPREKQRETLHVIWKALKKNGICYCSWKYGNEDRIAGGRHFTDFTEVSLRELLMTLPEFEVENIWSTSDVRKGREDQKWILNKLQKRRNGLFPGE